MKGRISCVCKYNSIEVIFKLTATLLPGLEVEAVDSCLSRRSLIVLQQKTKRNSQNVHHWAFLLKKGIFKVVNQLCVILL